MQALKGGVMQKTWKLTTVENGRPLASHNLSHRDAVRAIEWVARGGDIEDLICPQQPVKMEIHRTEQPAEVSVAA
jgi:hypothetical protein